MSEKMQKYRTIYRKTVNLHKIIKHRFVRCVFTQKINVQVGFSLTFFIFLSIII